MLEHMHAEEVVFAYDVYGRRESDEDDEDAKRESRNLPGIHFFGPVVALPERPHA